MTTKAAPLVFEKRDQKDRYQVRFWSTPERYKAFVAACEKEGIPMSDVFNQFLEWFAAGNAKVTEHHEAKEVDLKK